MRTPQVMRTALGTTTWRVPNGLARRSLTHALVATVAAATVEPACAQVPVASIALGWAVDTAGSPVRELARTVVAYYRLPQPGRTQTSLWRAEEQSRYPLYDLTARDLYKAGIQATIVGIAPATPDSSLYVIKTLFAWVDSTGGGIQPLGLQRLYANRAGNGRSGAWKLSGALHEISRGWPTHKVGGFIYHVDPGCRFDQSRAIEAERFVVSAARRLGIERPKGIDYYVTSSWESVNRLIGLDWGLSGSAFAGRAFPAERIVLAGNPAFGEAFTHELAHVVLAGFGDSERRSRLIEEGVATWLGGGNRGTDPSIYYVLLRDYLRTHPRVTFREFLESFGAEEAFYGTGALVTEVVVRREGRAGLGRLLALGPENSDLLLELPRLLGVNPDGLDAWWRGEAERASR
jgi:hypothetical protein